MRFRAWYAVDRGHWAVFSSADRSWQKLPGEGMLGGVVYLSTTVTPYRQIANGGDWYWIEGGRIRVSGTKWGGFVDPPDVDSSILKRSGRLSDEVWAAVQADMMAAREAPVV